jgi:hypothetical protein
METLSEYEAGFKAASRLLEEAIKALEAIVENGCFMDEDPREIAIETLQLINKLRS